MEIGSGHQGIIIYPSLLPTVDTVSKIGKRKEIEKEYKNFILLQSLPPSDLYRVETCLMGKVSDGNYQLIIEKIEGEALITYLDKNFITDDNSTNSWSSNYLGNQIPIPKEVFLIILFHLEQMKNKIKIMNFNGVYHNDISFENIMIDDSCKLVLIDFGFMNTIASDEDIKSIDTLIFSFLSLGIYNLEILEYMKDTYFITLKTYSTLTSEISLKTREQYALTKINPQIFRMENFKKLVPQELSFS